MREEFHVRLAELLKERKLSQKSFAELANITEAAVSRYLKGERIPRAAALRSMASALGVTTDYLMGGQAEGDSLEIVLTRNVNKLSDEEKKRLIAILSQDL